MIYIFETDRPEKSFISASEKLLTAERLEKMNRYKFSKDKNLCCISFLLLRLGLAEEYSIFSLPQINTSEFGKPFLVGEKIYFNFSHCDTGVVCAVGSDEVGVDIQNYTEHILDIKDRILSEKEFECVNLYSEYALEETVRYWTLKEAYGKYYGYGLGYSFNDKDFSDIVDSNLWQNYENLVIYSKKYENYALSVCSRKFLNFKYVSESDLSSFAKYIENNT